MAKVREPRCADCDRPGKAFPYARESGGHEWLCGPCAFKRTHPDAPPSPAMPWQRPPAPLQAERLF